MGGSIVQNKLVVKNFLKTFSLILAFIALLALICFGILFISTDGHMQIFAANSSDGIYTPSDDTIKCTHKEFIFEPSFSTTSAYYNDSYLYIYAIGYGKEFKSCTKDNFIINHFSDDNSENATTYNCCGIKVLDTDDNQIYKISLKFDIDYFSSNSMYIVSYIDNNNNEKATSVVENSYFAQ